MNFYQIVYRAMIDEHRWTPKAAYRWARSCYRNDQRLVSRYRRAGGGK